VPASVTMLNPQPPVILPKPCLCCWALCSQQPWIQQQGPQLGNAGACPPVLTHAVACSLSITQPSPQAPARASAARQRKPCGSSDSLAATHM
jgi:hypothetical protein